METFLNILLCSYLKTGNDLTTNRFHLKYVWTVNMFFPCVPFSDRLSSTLADLEELSEEHDQLAKRHAQVHTNTLSALASTALPLTTSYVQY